MRTSADALLRLAVRKRDVVRKRRDAKKATVETLLADVKRLDAEEKVLNELVTQYLIRSDPPSAPAATTQEPSTEQITRGAQMHQRLEEDGKLDAWHISYHPVTGEPRYTPNRE